MFGEKIRMLNVEKVTDMNVSEAFGFLEKVGERFSC